jgi:hypothetical protein
MMPEIYENEAGLNVRIVQPYRNGEGWFAVSPAPIESQVCCAILAQSFVPERQCLRAA